MSRPDLKIIPKTKWKKLKVDTTNIDPEFLSGFIGIEELTDYELTNEGFKETTKEKLPEFKPSINKRKICIEEFDPAESTNDKVEAEPSPKKRKKRKKQKIKVTKSYDCCLPKDDSSVSAVKNEKESSVNNSSDAVADGWAHYFIPDPVLRALSELGFNAPTQIQALTLPSAMRDRRDIVGAAETGSGKTLAFAIPIINHILQDKMDENGNNENENIPSISARRFRCLIMTPTRELAIQIKNHIVAVAKYTDIKICVVLGGMATEKQYRLLKRQPDIVIATPGRLWELIQEEEPHLMEVSNIRYLVVDEADRMLEAGHFEELTRLLKLINSNEEDKSKRQTFVFSATLTFVHMLPQRILIKKKKKDRLDSTKKISKLVKAMGIRDKPKIVDITQKSGTCETLTESRIHCNREEKDYYLYYILKRYPGKTIVFCNSIDCVRRLSKLFTWLQLNPLPLHASMHQKQRLKNLERFSDKRNQFLIATDVAARGLDIPNIQHVIHYQVPRTSESYIHRSGRTARAAKEGISILLIDSSEQNSYQKITRNLEKGLSDLPLFPVDISIMQEVKLRVNVARKLDTYEHRVRRSRAQNNWIETLAKSLDIDVDDDNNVMNDLGDERKQSKEKREMKLVKQYLDDLLKNPLKSKNFVTRYPTSMNKNIENILTTSDENETAIAVARKERTYIDRIKSELKQDDRRKIKAMENKRKRKAKKKIFSKSK